MALNSSAVDLAIQIVNYDTRPHLARCLESLVSNLRHSALEHRVLVLNNGSEDDLSDLERQYSDSVDFYPSKTNRGFGGGHNSLGGREGSEFLCFVNPDVVLTEPRVFERLLETLRNRSAAAVGPMLRSTEGTPQLWDHGELKGPRARIANGAGHAHWRARSKPEEAAWVSGAFLLMRRAAFEAAGGFDERYFLYKEDEDLCLQVRRLGLKVIYDPSVAVTHVGGVVARREEHLESSIAHYTSKNLAPQWRRRLLEMIYLHVSRRL